MRLVAMRLRRVVSHVVVLAAGLTVGIAVGIAIGSRAGLIRGMGHLQTEVAAGLALDVEVASSVRLGDQRRALELLDMRVDSAVLALTMAERNLGYLAAQADSKPVDSLAWAAAYRAVVPATGHNAAAVRSALQPVPPIRGERPLGPSLARLVATTRK